MFALGLLCGFALVYGARLLVNETTFPDLLIAPLLVPDTTGSADVMVVMGAGVIGECEGNINSVRRVLLSSRLWRDKRAPHILFTGGRAFGVPTCPVAVAMAHLAREVGVPDANVHVEVASQTTKENAELSALMLRRLGATRLLVVTDQLHMQRSAGTFEQLGFHVERASVPIYAGHVDNVSMLSAGAREAAALAYYRMRGWLGRPAGRVEVAPVTESAMQVDVRHPAGPIVVLGASYAAGWDLGSVAGAPVINRGVAGQQSFEMLERFERDVLPASPRAVILWGFINDVFRAPSGDVERALARARQSYTTMIEMARRRGIEPIVATEVTVRPLDSWSETVASWIGSMMGKEAYQDRINRQVIAMNRWLVDLARREDLVLLDLQSTLSEQGGRRRPEFSEEDGSHISAAGYQAITDYARPVLEEHLRRQ